jgi:hypothetical protein
MTFPNFLIIGAAKCGTSSVYMYLKQHPEIFMSAVKEPHFFSFTNETKRTNGPGDTVTEAITDIDVYESLFDGVREEKAIGEASPTYIYQPQAPDRIHQLIPDVKVIAILRNPAERAFSAYMHVVRDRREKAHDFAHALALEEKRINENWGPIWHYKNGGFYYQQLKRYFDRFPQENIKIILYEDLRQDQNTVLKEIFKFLDVDPNFEPDLSVKFNVSGEQKSKFIHTLTLLLFENPNPIRWFSRNLIPERLRWKVTNHVRRLNLKKQSIPADIKAELINQYREDIKKLETLINRDLSKWLES